MNLKKRIIVLAALLLSPSLLFAQNQAEREIRHLIVSVDSKTNGQSGKADVSAALIGMVKERRLLAAGDYLSVLQYSVFENDPTLQNYIRIPNYENVKMHLYDPIEDTTSISRILSPRNLRKYAQSNINEDGYSLSSIAKPYSIAALQAMARENNVQTPLVHKTYIALVTDHRYNGQDFYQELEAWHSLSNSKLKFTDIMRKCFDVEKEYFIQYVETREIGWSSFIDLYELVPLKKDISLRNALYFPPVVKTERIKEKGYRIRLEFHPIDPSQYKLVDIDIHPQPNDIEASVTMAGDTIVYDAYSPKRNHVTHLDISASINLLDGFYNATLLSPDHGSAGLKTTLNVEYPEDEKVLGIPLLDAFWFFFPNDQKMAAITMNILCCVLLAILIYLFFIWLGRYKPKDKQIHLE